MSRISIPFRWAAIAFAIAAAPQVMAHAGHDQLLRIDVEKAVVRLSLSVDGESLDAFDADADGKLSKKEFLTHADAISAWLDERITVVGKDHVVVDAVFSDQPITNFEELGDADDVGKIRVLRTYAIVPGDGTMLLRFDLFDPHHASIRYELWHDGRVSGGILTRDSPIVPL